MAIFYDTLIGEYIQNPGKKIVSIDKLSEINFDYKMINIDDLTIKGKINLSELELSKVTEYSGESVYITNLLYNKQINKNKDNYVLNNIELPLLIVLKDIELDGVRIDKELLKNIGEKLVERICSLEKSIYLGAGKEFNINSPKQVGELLFVDMGLPHGKKTKTGYSVNIDVLTDLAIEYSIAANILEYRHLSKLNSTYIEGLLKLLINTDIIHSSFNQTVTTTGRLSSTNPNLQNIPTGKGLAGEIRKAFIPFNNDEIIIAADYSQVEVRLLAIMSKDENLLGAFKEGIDIHYNTACFIFGKDDISSEERKIAKAVNFGVIYGISGFGLSKMIGISVKEAKLYIDKFGEKYPDVIKYFEEIKDNCKKNGYVETMYGRKRFIPGINDSNSFIKKAAEREALNMPIQGTAADVIKIAMIKLSDFLNKNDLKSKMIMQVHDEIVFSAKKDEEVILKKAIVDIMENIIDSDIKLTVDIGIGDNRGEAK